jgi:hypothetical protein
MVKKSTFRTFSLVVGFFGVVFIIISNAGGFAKFIGITISILFIIFGFLVTGKWSKYIIGEEQEAPGIKGSLGG